MSDVLGYLSEVVHRVSATFMPTEMEDVAAFLRGDAWVLLAAQTSQVHRSDDGGAAQKETSATNGDDGGDDGGRSGDDTSAAARLIHSHHSTTLLRYPLGATRWGPFIPLGIAGTALVSAATSGSRAVLMNFFESSGFAQVFAVNLVPTEQQQQQLHGGSTAFPTAAPTAPSSSSALLFSTRSDGARGAATSRKRQRSAHSTTPTPAATVAPAHVVDVTLDGSYGTTAQAARHACMAAVREWFANLEESLREHEADDTAPPSTRKTQLRRLLVLVRCCADNGNTVSTRSSGGGGGGPHGSMSGTGGASASIFAVGSSRHHRKGHDPLLLFLHDLAALSTLYEARLAATTCTVRPAVLLLPEDESYGGALLQQRLKEEVGYRYWVQLFLQSDHSAHPAQRGTGTAADASSSSPTATAAATMVAAASGVRWKTSLVSRRAEHRSGLPPALLHRQQSETPLQRGCRLAAFWGVLDASVLSTAASFADSPADGPHATTTLSFAHASAAQLEEALRRHPACFLLRPSNAPLCVFLMEALRRFPVVAPLAMLRHWQSTWTARHALPDLLFAFHTAVCPFALSATQQETPRASSPPSLQTVCDATDLLDALLDAAFTLAEDRDNLQSLSSNDFRIEQAVLFLLMYEALVQQQEGRLRRIPGVVAALLRLFDRHRRDVSDDATALATADDKVRYAVRHLLPYTSLNVFYTAVQQCSATRQGKVGSTSTTPPLSHESTTREVSAYAMNPLVLPLRRMSVAPQLQNATLLSLLPPDASLLELRGVAEKMWEEELPALWRHLVQRLGQRSDSATATTTAADEEGSDEQWPYVTPSTQLSADNFYHPLIPHAVRVLYLLTAHALHASTEAAKQVPVVQLQVVCQLSDEQLLLVLRELQMAGLASTNLKTQTARTLLDSI